MMIEIGSRRVHIDIFSGEKLDALNFLLTQDLDEELDIAIRMEIKKLEESISK